MDNIGILAGIVVLTLIIILTLIRVRNRPRPPQEKQLRFNPHRDSIERGNKVQVTPRISQIEKRLEKDVKPRRRIRPNNN